MMSTILIGSPSLDPAGLVPFSNPCLVLISAIQDPTLISKFAKLPAIYCASAHLNHAGLVPLFDSCLVLISAIQDPTLVSKFAE